MLAAASLVVVDFAWIDAVAPRVLDLPYHHCLYEAITRVPAIGGAALLTAAGGGALLLLPLLAALRSRAPAAVDAVARLACEVSWRAHLAALIVVAIHVWP